LVRVTWTVLGVQGVFDPLLFLFYLQIEISPGFTTGEVGAEADAHSSLRRWLID
jgi:hypothetical protein